MRKKQGKRRHGFLKALAIILIITIGGYFFLMTHTQIIVGAIQKLSQGTVNTKNLFSPLSDPTEGIKENGQYIITEIGYSDVYPKGGECDDPENHSHRRGKMQRLRPVRRGLP